jgi:hypothetical protein
MRLLRGRICVPVVLRASRGDGIWGALLRKDPWWNGMFSLRTVPDDYDLRSIWLWCIEIAGANGFDGLR